MIQTLNIVMFGVCCGLAFDRLVFMTGKAGWAAAYAGFAAMFAFSAWGA